MVIYADSLSVFLVEMHKQFDDLFFPEAASSTAAFLTRLKWSRWGQENCLRQRVHKYVAVDKGIQLQQTS